MSPEQARPTLNWDNYKTALTHEANATYGNECVLEVGVQCVECNQGKPVLADPKLVIKLHQFMDDSMRVVLNAIVEHELNEHGREWMSL